MKIKITEEDFIKLLPHLPGVYRFYDITENLLYVGKAIDLNKRVKSYFRKQNDTSPRIALMVSKISQIEFTITENETSALILENNLIKSLKPKYNIIFRDDKTYPFIRISKHDFPKIDYYRGKTNQQNMFFGPYPNATSVKETLDTIQRIFKLRTCSDGFFQSRQRPCILYQIKRCTAPCVNYVNKIEYASQIKLAINFLNGNFSEIINTLTVDMYAAAECMDFELAASLRDKISMMKQTQTSQIISTHETPLCADLIIHQVVSSQLFIYTIMVRNGIYIGDNHYVLDIIAEDWLNSLESFLDSYYIIGRNTDKIIVDTQLGQEFITFFKNALSIKIDNKITGNIEKLFAMGRVNLLNIIENSKGNLNEAEIELSKLSGVEKIHRIECLDVSHNHGDDAVAGLVVYENGIIDNSKYRKYNLPSSVNGNDILAIETVLNRRFTSTTMMLPDIFLVDGGRAQFETVKNIVMKYELCGKIKVVSIFKGAGRDPKLDRLIFEDGNVVSYFDAPLVFKLMQGLRDEAHRFAITGHRKKQAKKMTASLVDDIPNIGSKKRKILLAHFGSVKNISNASVEDLQKVVGIGSLLANQIYLFFH